MSEITEKLLDIVMERHPWPWRVERDWGYDVIDGNGVRVAMFSTDLAAHQMAALAKQRYMTTEEGRLELEVEVRKFLLEQEA